MSKIREIYNKSVLVFALTLPFLGAIMILENFSEEFYMHYTEEKDLLLCYITDIFGHYDYGKDMFLSAAGYRKDGKVIDHMFDSYIFLSQPNYLYTYLKAAAMSSRPSQKPIGLTTSQTKNLRRIPHLPL